MPGPEQCCTLGKLMPGSYSSGDSAGETFLSKGPELGSETLLGGVEEAGDSCGLSPWFADHGSSARPSLQ
jgi:hypothetical protein